MENSTSAFKRMWMLVLAFVVVTSMLLAACNDEGEDEAAVDGGDEAAEVVETGDEATEEEGDVDVEATEAVVEEATEAEATEAETPDVAAAGVAVDEVCGDYPDQAVEFTVPFAPGGGSDNLARTITSILQSEGITDATINVVNREGGSGTVGQNFVAGKAGNDYVIMTGTPSLVTNPIVLGSDVGYEDFTPLALLALDQLLIVVPADSPFQTIEELIEAAEASPDEISWGGTGLGGEDSLTLAQIEKSTGANLNYVSFESGGEVQAALLGGHVDVASANPNEIIGQLEAGEIRALAIAGEERAEALPEVPTLIESGIDAQFEQFRGIFGPPEMSPEAVECWSAIFQTLTESEAWQTEYIEANMLRSEFLPPDEFAVWLDEESARLAALVEEMGLDQQ